MMTTMIRRFAPSVHYAALVHYATCNYSHAGRVYGVCIHVWLAHRPLVFLRLLVLRPLSVRKSEK
jgi:hypothetical protein